MAKKVITANEKGRLATISGYLRAAHLKWFLNKAKLLGLVGSDCRTIEDLGEVIYLRWNELRNSELVVWTGGYSEYPKTVLDSIYERSRRALGFARAFIPEEGERSAYPALYAFARAAVSDGKGVWSEAARRNGSWLVLLQETRCWSPGKLERALWAAREAFNTKFPSQEGRVSWLVLGRALRVVGVRSPGKAAIVARAIQLGWQDDIHALRNKHTLFRSAREHLVDAMRAERVASKVEGMRTYPLKEIRRRGNITLYEAMVRRNHGWRRELCFSHSVWGLYCTHTDEWLAWLLAIEHFRVQKLKRNCTRNQEAK